MVVEQNQANTGFDKHARNEKFLCLSPVFKPASRIIKRSSTKCTRTGHDATAQLNFWGTERLFVNCLDWSSENPLTNLVQFLI